jgi:predicted regulator of Ras-like GTPase activity (Roadblock/LC7/MglB family)
VNDGAVLELPLKVVAPMFLTRQREAVKAHQQVSIDDNIPNLFFGFPQAEPANGPTVAQATAKPADTNYYVWDDSSDTVRVQESEVKRGPTPGTSFVAKYATPNEVVSRAAGLDGVAGALIALPDGLMVASRLSTDLNADTLAAFLPQIFGKVSQCTRELRMGDLNNLNFTVGNIPWKIFRVNAIFFAAFGRPGEALPTSQLAALAGELDHKPK